jgi:hypothetical protein
MVRMKLRLVAAAAGLSTAITAMLVPALATAASDDCSEELSAYDPHDLVEDPDILLDLPTLIDVEGLVDDYTYRIDDALDAESDGLEPPEGVSSDDLIDEARSEIVDTIDLGRSIAGCDE